MSETLRLYGTPISTYFNKVKIALIELELPFEEIETMPGRLNWPDTGSPAGTVPYLKNGDDTVYESQVIIEYLEEIRPANSPSMYPSDPLDRARCRELIQYLEIYMDTPARPLFKAAYWGKELPVGALDAALPQFERGLTALARRANFSPWLCGDQFTHADAVAWVHLATLRHALSLLGHTGFLETKLPQLGPYFEALSNRASIQRVDADRRQAARLFQQQQQQNKAG